MKQIQKFSSAINRVVAVFTLSLLTAAVWAQDKGLDIDVDVDKGGNGWYANPIVWVIGAAVFILLLVALLKGNKEA